MTKITERFLVGIVSGLNGSIPRSVLANAVLGELPGDVGDSRRRRKADVAISKSVTVIIAENRHGRREARVRSSFST